MRHGRTSLGWAARGSIAGIAPAYQGQNTEWATNSGNYYTSSDHWYELWINYLEKENWKVAVNLRIFANNTRFSRRQLILMPIVSTTQDFYYGEGCSRSMCLPQRLAQYQCKNWGTLVKLLYRVCKLAGADSASVCVLQRTQTSTGGNAVMPRCKCWSLSRAFDWISG